MKRIRLVSLGIVAVLKHRWGSRGTCWPGAFLSPGSSTWPRVRAAGCCSTPRPADASDLRGGQLRFDRAGGAVRGPDLGRYFLAAGYFGHAAWDVAHHIANKVVPRSYADFCGVVDLLLGFAILFP